MTPAPLTGSLVYLRGGELARVIAVDPTPRGELAVGVRLDCGCCVGVNERHVIALGPDTPETRLRVAQGGTA